MMSANHYRYPAHRSTGGVLPGIIFRTLFLLLLPLSLRGQTPGVAPADDEEPLYAVQKADARLSTPAESPMFVLIRRTHISRIVTLHREPVAAAEPGAITLLNVNGEFKVGTWEVTVEPVPGEAGLSYWVVHVDKFVPPGKYQVIVNRPETWVNTAATQREGFVWVFSRKEIVL